MPDCMATEVGECEWYGSGYDHLCGKSKGHTGSHECACGAEWDDAIRHTAGADERPTTGHRDRYGCQAVTSLTGFQPKILPTKQVSPQF